MIQKLPHLFCALVVATTFSSFAAAADPTPAAAPAAVEPPTSWIDPATGHRVVRLTREPGSASLYFNDNGYTPDGRQMLYTTADGISVLDLTTFKTRSVVQGQVRAIVVGHKTPSVFFLKPSEQALYSTNLDTGETRKLAALPSRGTIGSINADETFAAGTYIEGGTRAEQNHPLEQAPNKGQMMEQRLAARLPLVLYTVDLRTGQTNAVQHSTDWVNHLQFSPTDPTLFMYCHEGP
jgi:oligogalacturonide lyase